MNKLPGPAQLFTAAVALTVAALNGCVSRSHARAEARAAYQAGQQDAMTRLQQLRGPSVIVAGPVKNSLIPWTPELTLARAIVLADYVGPKDPQHIFILRKGQQVPVTPAQLLSGEDLPVQSGDIIQLEP